MVRSIVDAVRSIVDVVVRSIVDVAVVSFFSPCVLCFISTFFVVLLLFVFWPSLCGVFVGVSSCGSVIRLGLAPSFH